MGATPRGVFVEGGNMKTLVTGASGFVGSHLVEALVSRGHEVRALVRKRSDRRWIHSLPVEFSIGDVSDPSSLEEAVKGVDWVFHVAGVTKARGLSSYLRANAQGTRNLLEACWKRNRALKRFVLLSSLAAWGPSSPHCPREETDECSPVSHYGFSKAMAEKETCLYAGRLPVVILRPTAVYGPRDRDILAFFKMVKRGIFLRVGSGERCVCMIHVRDLVEGILLAAVREVPSGSIYNLSDGCVRTWSEVARTMAKVMDVHLREITVPVSLAKAVALLSEFSSAVTGRPPLFNRQKLREMLEDGWTCSIEKARMDLGFRPRIPLEEGLRETYLWYKEMGWL